MDLKSIKGALKSAAGKASKAAHEAGISAYASAKGAVANAASVVPADCAALYGRGLEWRCLMGQYRLPLVRASLATVAFQFDSYQLDYNIWAGDSASASGGARECSRVAAV